MPGRTHARRQPVPVSRTSPGPSRRCPGRARFTGRGMAALRPFCLEDADGLAPETGSRSGRSWKAGTPRARETPKLPRDSVTVGAAADGVVPRLPLAPTPASRGGRAASSPEPLPCPTLQIPITERGRGEQKDARVNSCNPCKTGCRTWLRLRGCVAEIELASGPGSEAAASRTRAESLPAVARYGTELNFSRRPSRGTSGAAPRRNLPLGNRAELLIHLQ